MNTDQTRIPESVFDPCSPVAELLTFAVVPTAAIAGQKFIGGFRAPGAGGVFHQAFAALLFPRLHDGLDDGPTQFGHVGPAEERWIADHAVVKQPFVTGTRML